VFYKWVFNKRVLRKRAFRKWAFQFTFENLLHQKFWNFSALLQRIGLHRTRLVGVVVVNTAGQVYKLSEDALVQLIASENSIILRRTNSCPADSLLSHTWRSGDCFFSLDILYCLNVTIWADLIFSLVFILSLHKVAFFIYCAFICFICFHFYTKLPDENEQEDLSHKVAVKADHPGSQSLYISFDVSRILVQFEEVHEKQNRRDQNQHQHAEMAPHNVLVQLFHHVELFYCASKPPERVC